MPSGQIERAIALVLLAHLLFALVDTSTKWLLGAGLAVLQLAFLRYAVHFAITLVESGLRKPAWPRMSVRLWALICLRSLCLMTATMANFLALGQLPLVVTSAILFLSPVLVCLFARPLLGERLTPARLVAVGLGFSGVLVILNPFDATVNWYAVLMLYPASAMALYMVLTRMLSGQTSPLVMQFSTGAIGTVGLLPFGLAAWVTPETGLAWGLALALGLFAWAGHEVLTRAHAFAEASLLAPYGYSFVIYLALTGWLVFGDVPTPQTVLGAGLVIFAGLIVHRGTRRAP